VSSEQLLRSLGLAVEATPDDVPLRLHFAQLLAADGQRHEAVRQAAAVLMREPDNAQALLLLTETPVPRDSAVGDESDAADAPPVRSEWETLQQLDAELSELAPPMFASATDEPAASSDVERTGLRLADVGGMEEVKARLEAAILAPVRNPQLVALYGKSLKGGLLLYGPPGCGKTFIARAVAGEMGANFLSVSLADVLDMYIGQSERNLHEIFATARANAPCVVFLDEIDALGQKRSQMRNSAARGTVNQLLTEMDGVTGDNDGVYVLGATNHPWDVDVALRRPGRFDRMVLVLPPDLPAREAIFKFHLIDRPIANVDLPRLARLTDGYSGADIAFICESAAGIALLDSARTNTVRMIGMADLEHAVRDVRPSVGPWLDTARNVAQFANDSGTYDDLLAYLRKRRLV
jgi:SpoVK/Ycf46/Vps4 family AAA+-type ATPase